jgi:nucleotide-binding universal stress UspA family protein
LLVLGSTGPDAGQTVSSGHTTRQLLHDLSCPIALAPRGLSTRRGWALRRIAVGYDGGKHTAAALALGQQLAYAADAELHVLGAVDDRVPSPRRAQQRVQQLGDESEQTLDERVAALKRQIDEVVDDDWLEVYPEVVRGAASAALEALSEQVDLVVIGSQRRAPWPGCRSVTPARRSSSAATRRC